MLISLFCHHTPSGGAFDEAYLHKIGFIHFFDGRFFFGKRGGYRLEADRAAVELLGDDGKDVAVYLCEAEFVDLEKSKGLLDYLERQWLTVDLGEVASALKKIIRCARGRARTARDLKERSVVGVDAEDLSASLEDGRQFLVRIIGEAEGPAGEARAQWRGEHRDACSGGDEGKRRQFELYGARGRPFADDDVEYAGLHGRVEDLFDGAIEAVDFVDKEDVSGREVGEDGGEVADTLDSGAAGLPQ